MNLKDATILVVEDEPDLLEVMGESLAPVAGKILSASNGEDALKSLERAAVDAIVTDVRMPGMGGVALLQRVRAASPHGPAVILVSGYSDLTAREALNLGADATLAKPVRRRDMIEALERALADKRELWHRPNPGGESAQLAQEFAGLTQAVAGGEIAFGRGGFCIRTRQELSQEPVSLSLKFASDQHSLSGRGIVRWDDLKDQEAGIEIVSLAESCVEWVFGLTGSSRQGPFIPYHTAKTSAPSLGHGEAVTRQ
jgi:CheY-like chemotaxis protein